MKNFTFQKRSKKKCSCIRGQIIPTRNNNRKNQYACHDLSVWNKRQKSHSISQNVFPPSIIYPSEKKKKIIGTSSILVWGKSRVLPTDPLFTPKTSLKKWIRFATNFIDLIQFYLIWQMFANFSQVESGKDNFSVVFTYSIKRAYGIRKFHVAVVQRRQRNAQNSALHVQSCCFVNKNPLLFCRSPCRQRCRLFRCHPEIVLPW